MFRMGSLLSGAVIGLTIAAPIGPMAILCINRTLNAGILASISTGAGASTIQLAYGTIVLLGLKGVGPLLNGNRQILGVLGAVLILSLAWRMLQPRVVAPVTRASSRSLLGHYGSAILVNSANPMLLILLISAVAAVIGTEPPGTGTVHLILGGMFLGSFGWWVGLAGMTAAVGGRLNSGVVRGVNKAAALAMIGFGLVALSRALGS